MDNKTICEIFEASKNASDFKKSFMCAQESLHEGLLNSPWPIFIYAFSVLFVMFLVQRSATRHIKSSIDKNVGWEISFLLSILYPLQIFLSVLGKKSCSV